MIACEKVRDPGELMEELIFEAKKGRWSDYSCFWIDFASYHFGLTLL